MGWFGNMVMKMLKIQPARDRAIIIKEPLSHAGNVLKNRIWYRGDPSELDQFFKKSALDDITKSRFWAAVPSSGYVRKFHSGLPAIMVERLADIVVADIDSLTVNNSPSKQGDTKTWEEIAKDNGFNSVLSDAVIQTLVTGDGAFKISIDTDLSRYPIISFYSGENVEYDMDKGRLREIWFYDHYEKNNKDYRLKTIYGQGYVDYVLYDGSEKQVDLNTLPETAGLERTTYDGGFIMGVPLSFFPSPKFKGRGRSVYDSKSDSFDALDETISQWVDAIRDGRVNKYIPEEMIPRDPKKGELLTPNPFDNKFIKVIGGMSEEGGSKIEVVQPQINYEAYVNTYASNVDMCLQGIVSPSTIGIDLKKTDNAESQREKEKATLYTRGKIIDTLSEAVPALVETSLKAYDLLNNKNPGEYEAVIEFGEYGSPTFEQTITTIGEAAQHELMSIEQMVDSIWGDRKDEDWKKQEVLRIKELKGVAVMEEPAVNMEGLDTDTEEAPDNPGEGGGTKLNGAQVASLMNVIGMVKNGTVSRTEAIAIITSTLGISKENAEKFIEEQM